MEYLEGFCLFFFSQFPCVLGDELTHFFVLFRTFAVRWTIGANLDLIMEQESIEHLREASAALLKAFIDEIHT